VDAVRRFNRQVVYEGIRLFVDEFAAPYVEGRPPAFTFEDLQGFTQVGGITLVEIYALDGSRIFTTGPDLTPLQTDMEAVRLPLQGTTTSSFWVSGRGRRAATTQTNSVLSTFCGVASSQMSSGGRCTARTG
jgi:hypothetical protein